MDLGVSYKIERGACYMDFEKKIALSARESTQQPQTVKVDSDAAGHPQGEPPIVYGQCAEEAGSADMPESPRDPAAHKHHHENTKAVLNRMSRVIGHMEAVKKMVEDGRDCSEILIQIAAVRAAINNIGKIILEDHISHCVVDAIESGDEQVIKDLNEAINKFVR